MLVQAVPADPELTEACGVDPSFVCRRVLDWTGSPGAAEAVDVAFGKPATIAVVVLLAWLANKVVSRAVDRFSASLGGADPANRRVKRRLRATRLGGRVPGMLETGQVSLRAAARARTIGLVLRSMATFAIWAVAGATILGELGISIGPLIASAGIAGVALGFGAQSLVKDFLSGIFMLIEDQYGVGDIVDAGEASGTVEAVSLRSTRLRDVNGTVWHIPNGQIVRIGNMSQQWARALLDVDVAYGTDVDVAQATIKAVADRLWADPSWRGQILEEPEVWGIERFGTDGMAIRLVVKTQPSEQFGVLRELRRRLKAAFDEAGIEIPFPQRTIWVRREPGHSVEVESGAADLDG